MTFSERDLKPNQSIPLDQVRAGSVGDARWSSVPDGVDRIDRLKARPPMPRYARERERP